MNQNSNQPIPQGKYLPAVRHADMIYTSGMTPRKAGVLMYSGKIKVTEPIDSYKEAVHLATLNALIAAQNCLKVGETISQILQLTVYLNAEHGFILHAKIADFASELLIEHLGNDCIGSRVAIGVATLPSDATVEIAIIGKVD